MARISRASRFVCNEPASLVIIDVLPLCAVDALDMVDFELLSSDAPTASDAALEVVSGAAGHCTAVVPCEDALALLEELDHVCR